MAIKSDLSSIANKAGYIPSADWTNYLRGLTPEGREELRASLFGESPTQVPILYPEVQDLSNEIYTRMNRMSMGYENQLGTTGLDSDWIPGMNYASPYAPQEEYDLVRKAYQLYMQNNGPEWSDSPLGIIHAPMTWAFSNAGELLNDMPNVAKALFSPSTAAYGAVKELRGPIDALENIVLPIVSMAYTGSTAGGQLSASAHNLMRRKSTGEDIDWSGYAQETGEGALTGGVLSAAGGPPRPRPARRRGGACWRAYLRPAIRLRPFRRGKQGHWEHGIAAHQGWVCGRKRNGDGNVFLAYLLPFAFFSWNAGWRRCLVTACGPV
jgi:hypothetical protein